MSILLWCVFDDHDLYITAAKHEHIVTFYNYWGSMQDYQRFYEAKSVDMMLKYCDIQDDSNLFEYGYGTGYLARQLLTKYKNIQYSGVDVSMTMHKLAQDNLKSFNQDNINLYINMNASINSLKIQSGNVYALIYLF